MEQKWSETVRLFEQAFFLKRKDKPTTVRKRRQLAAQELRRVLQLPLVEKVSMKGNYLHVTTHPLSLKDIVFGEFDLTVGILKGYGFRTKNKTPVRTPGDRFPSDHPYAYNGTVCFGNCARAIELARNEGNIANCVVLIIDFIQGMRISQKNYILKEFEKKGRVNK